MIYQSHHIISRLFHIMCNCVASLFFSRFMLHVTIQKEKVKMWMIERKDVGGGENWGILEVRENKEGIFLYQIRRGYFNVKIGMVIMWEDCCGGGSIAVLCGAHNKN